MLGGRQYWCGDEGGLFTVSAGHECVGGTRGSCIVASATDVIYMGVVRG